MECHVGFVLDSNNGCGCGQTCVADVCFSGSERKVPEFCLDVAFNEGGDALVEPEVFPIAWRDLVASVRLTSISHEHVLLRFVTNNGRDGGVRQQRIRCAALGEGWRHDNYGVVAPDVRSLDVLLNRVNDSL